MLLINGLLKYTGTTDGNVYVISTCKWISPKKEKFVNFQRFIGLWRCLCMGVFCDVTCFGNVELNINLENSKRI